MIVYEVHCRNKMGLDSSTFVPLSYVREMELFMNLTGNVCWPVLLKPAEYMQLPLEEKETLRFLDAAIKGK